MNERNSNIELLRVICIVMIISMHVFGQHTGSLNGWGILALSFNNAVCNLGVSIFMLISGFYGIKFKSLKILTLWNISLFWSIALIVVDADYSTKNIVRSIFPVFTGKYWFLTVYIVIACLAPYIDKMINQICKRQFLTLITVLGMFFVVAPSFLMLEIMHDSGKGFMNMLLVYLIGRYMANYGLPNWLTGLSGRGALLLIIVIVTSVDFAVSYRFGISFQMLARDNSIFILTGAIIVFTMVMTMKPRTIAWVNSLGSYVFPIYLIQGTLHHRLIYTPGSTHSILYLMVWVNTVMITTGAIVMEFVRRKLLGRLFCCLLKKEMMIIKKIKSKYRNGLILPAQ